MRRDPGSRARSPPTPASSATMLAIRPPSDLPPMTRFLAPSCSITANQVSRSTDWRSGGRCLPVCRRWVMYGNSNRTTRKPGGGQPFREEGQERAVHAGAGPVSQDDGRLGRARSVDQELDRLAHRSAPCCPNQFSMPWLLSRDWLHALWTVVPWAVDQRADRLGNQLPTGVWSQEREQFLFVL